MGAHSNNLIITPTDPADLGFPATLPLELALGDLSPREIFEAYGLGKSDYLRLQANPYFLQAIEENLELLKKEGMSFKLRARAQCSELLKTSFQLVHHEDTPPSVKADLIKYTIRVAGYDASLDQKANQPMGGVNFQIVMNLGD